MGDSSPPQLRAPAPGAAAPSPAGRATPIRCLRPPPQVVNVRPLPFRRDSSRTSHVQELTSVYEEFCPTLYFQGARGDNTDRCGGRGSYRFAGDSSLQFSSVALFSLHAFLPFVVGRDPAVIPTWRMQ